MKKIYSFALTAAAIAAVGCSREELPLTPATSQEDIPVVPAHMRSLDEALNEAQGIISAMSVEDDTRSTKARTVKSVELITNGAVTRSAESDTVLYLINYKEGGFAILGRPKLSHPLYAFSDEGSFSMADTVGSPVGLFIHDAILDASIAAEEAADLITPIGPGILPPIINYSYSVCRQVKPMLPKHVSRWHQDDPYNAFAPELPRDFDHGELVGRHIAKGVVGCVPLSAGQLMAYYKWPKRLPPVDPPYTYSAPLDWDKMTTGMNDTAVAYFLEELAGSTYYKARYRKGTGADKDLVMGDSRASSDIFNSTAFNRIGYEITNCFSGLDFSQSILREEVLEFMSGKDSSETTPAAPVLVANYWIGETGGHQWVMDGYVEYDKISITNPNISLGHDLFLHCIWGECKSSVHGYYLYSPNENALSSTSKEGEDYGYRATDLLIYGRYTLDK